MAEFRVKNTCFLDGRRYKEGDIYSGSFEKTPSFLEEIVVDIPKAPRAKDKKTEE